MSESTFRPGWHPEFGARALESFQSRGRVFASAAFEDSRPRPRGFSLSFLLAWAYNQGPVGSCFANMMAGILQILEGAENKAAGSERWEVANPSRRLLWYGCRKLDGSLGSSGDGGSIVNAFAAAGPKPDGLGVCREDEWPYKAEHRWLEATPPDAVLADCQIHIHDIARATDLGDWDRLNFSGYPIGLGIWWPGGCEGCKGWDYGLIDELGRTTGIGRGSFGHAIARIGWFKDWDGHDYSQILNSHGGIYPALPPEVASEITGYKPTAGAKTHDFWVRDDMLAEVIHKQSGGNAELYTGALASGYQAKDIDTGWSNWI